MTENNKTVYVGMSADMNHPGYNRGEIVARGRYEDIVNNNEQFKVMANKL